MFTREVRLLMRKEWRHLLRSRGAMLTALLFPVLFLLIIPGAQVLAFTLDPTGGSSQVNIPPGMPLPAGLAEIGDDPQAMLRLLLLPLFMIIGGLVVPSMTANYTLIAERENRTLELLVALPVRVSQVLLAKLLVIIILAAGVTLTLFAIDAVLLLALGIAGAGYIVALLLLLLCALAYSTASALLISLLARDFRTANNLTGAAIGPLILGSVAFMMFVPGGAWTVVLLAGIYALLAIASAVIAMRVVTFERLLR
jgi:ABC-type Na+ efflux pump permease subunit